jgi:uncharacterized protein involved in cysteine biosynthesis
MGALARGVRVPSLLEWRHALRCALVASGIAAVLGFFVSAVMGPFPGLIAWTIVSGIVAVAMYARRVRPMPLPPGAGTRIGALTGVLGFVLVCLLSSLQLMMRGGAEFRSLLQEQLRHSSAAADPAVQQWVDYFLSPGGMMVMMLISLVFTFALFVGLSSVGGMIGARISGRRR